jgi:pyruvate kinase
MVMVARGDLGTEIPLEDIPKAQMEIVKTCQLRNTPVIVATQMMSSMVDNPSPTRAEVSDVFLAVREGVDYVMLSEETTIGHYPIQTVEMMKKIIQEAQN